MAESKIAVQAKPSASNWIPKLIIGVIIGLFTLVVYSSTTLVKGIEFNPGTWQVREFSFRADPFTGFQFTGIQYDNKVATVDKSITALLDRKVRRENDRWELASIEQFAAAQTGPCMGVVQLISGYGVSRGTEAVEFWKKWTVDQPNKANVFWLAVQQLAIRGQYDAIADLLDLPLVESNDQRFKDKLSSIMTGVCPECTESKNPIQSKPSAVPTSG